MPRSAVLGMRMPGGWLHRSCDSLARSVFSSCWVLSAIFFVFPRCFSSLRAVRHRCRQFRELFFVFSVCFFEGLVHIPRNTLLYLVALFGLNLRGDSDSGHLPGFSAVATSDVGSLSGERSAKFYQRYVRQFQVASFATSVPSTYSSTSTVCHSSSLAGSGTVVFPWFLVLLSRPSRRCRHHPCSIIHWYCRPAAQPWHLR